MKYGKSAEALELFAESGADVPALQERESIHGFEWLWDAYNMLSTCRPVGMGTGPIPWTAVQYYADTERLNVFQSDLLHAVVRHLDGIFMDHMREKQQQSHASGRHKSR